VRTTPGSRRMCLRSVAMIAEGRWHNLPHTPHFQVPGWVPGEPTTRHRWLPPLESWAKRSLI
jgi:hypothetical protein